MAVCQKHRFDNPASGKSLPELLRKLLCDFCGTSLTVDFKSFLPEVPQKFPRLPWKFPCPDFPGSSPDLPRSQPLSLGRPPKPSDDSQKVPWSLSRLRLFRAMCLIDYGEPNGPAKVQTECFHTISG